MASQITILMKQLVEVMRNKGLSAPHYLNSGLSRQEILELTAGIIELPEDVIAFYEFTNGASITDTLVAIRDVAIWYIYIVMSLQEALRVREEFMERLQDDDFTSAWLEETGVNVHGWFPLLYDNGNLIFVDVNRLSRNEPCMFATSKASDPEIVYVSLESMLRTFIACY